MERARAPAAPVLVRRAGAQGATRQRQNRRRRQMCLGLAAWFAPMLLGEAVISTLARNDDVRRNRSGTVSHASNRNNSQAYSLKIYEVKNLISCIGMRFFSKEC